MTSDQIKENAWSSYWRKGFLTTFVDHNNDNYSGIIKDFWWAQFDALDEHAIVVDLGAGNGALLALALDYMSSKNRHLELVAVDSANIGENSEFYQSNTSINVRANTPIEATGLASSSVDLCISQFGFEYADIAKSIPEVARILKPQGVFSGLMHHAQSPVSINSKIALEQINVCQESQLDRIAAKLISRLADLKERGQDPKPDTEASSLRMQFNASAERLLTYGKRFENRDHISYFLNEIANIFGKKAVHLSSGQKLELIEKVAVDSEHYRLRMQAMLDASQNDAQIIEMERVFQGNGFQVSKLEEMRDQSTIMAWKFTGTKK